MKKVLSVLLAAAMVMGMSVTSMAAADKNWGSANSNTCNTAVSASELHFDDVMVVVRDTHGVHGSTASTSTALIVNESGVVTSKDGVALDADKQYDFGGFMPGDVLYFTINKSATDNDYLTSVLDQHWTLNIKANDHIKAAEFYAPKATDIAPWSGTTFGNTYKYVKITLVSDFDSTSSDKVNFYMYIADNLTQQTSKTATVKYNFANAVEKYVDFNFTNDADHAATWVVAKDKKGTAVFDFDDSIYFTVKMVSEEKVTLNLSQKYDVDIDEEYNEYDADLDFYNFKGSKDSFIKEGELFIPSAKDDKFIYEVVDGELVAVEAEYEKEYKLANVGTKKGYVINTDELGYYVVADEELVVAEEEVEVEAETPAETDKANPETGANDFVGAAVALAVVSVAAAGALALKK